MVFCPYDVFKSSLCLPWGFFIALVASTLQEHYLLQTTVTKPNMKLALSTLTSKTHINHVSSFQICVFQAFVCWNQTHRPHSRHPTSKTQKHDNWFLPSAPPRAHWSFKLLNTSCFMVLTRKSLFGRPHCHPICKTTKARLSLSVVRAFICHHCDTYLSGLLCTSMH